MPELTADERWESDLRSVSAARKTHSERVLLRLLDAERERADAAEAKVAGCNGRHWVEVTDADMDW